MIQKQFGVYLFIIIYLAKSIFASPEERRLLKDLFDEKGYNKFERPVQNDSQTVPVSMGLSLYHILDLDEKTQVLITSAILNLQWYDYNLVWSPEDYGDIKHIRVPSTHIWTPDIVLYNSIDENSDQLPETNLIISYDGSVQYVPRKTFKSYCEVNKTSTSVCVLEFGSWTYNSKEINITMQQSEVNLDSNMIHPRWHVKNTSSQIHSIKYECCKETYTKIRFQLEIDHEYDNDVGEPIIHNYKKQQDQT